MQSRRIPVVSVVLVTYPAGLAGVGILALLFGGDLPAGQAGIAAVAGAAGAVAIGLFYGAMAAGPVSVVAPVAAMGVAVPVAVGLLRGEAPSALQAAGLAVGLVGIAAAVRESPAEGTVAVPARSVLLAALAGLGFGAFFVGIDSAASRDALWATAATRVGGCAVIAVVALALPRQVVLSRPLLPVLILIGLLDAAANGLFAFATTHGLLSLVSVAGSLYPVVTILLARLVLGERLSRLQQGGVGLAIAGVALIAAG